MNQALSELADQLENDSATLDRELAEIEMLLRQTRTEAERHEGRRSQAEERVTVLESDSQAPLETVVDARTQLLNQTRRATMMHAQIEVLEGKQRALRRYHERLAHALPVLRSESSPPGDIGDGAGAVVAPVTVPAAPPVQSDNRQPASHEVLAAQEQMRREIARQMHDGPAQSIANIALQAQIVQRLFERNPGGAQTELSELVTMVEDALKATKDFIFDVRPMVLDDLGLVPTLRRAAAERTRRTGVPVRFESSGADGRLSSEIESAMFRIVDDALSAYAGARTPEIFIRLDWTDATLTALVRGRPETVEEPEAKRARAAVAAARHEKQIPHALASMIREREREDAERSAGMPSETWLEIEQRAASIGIRVTLTADRWQLDAALDRA